MKRVIIPITTIAAIALSASSFGVTNNAASTKILSAKVNQLSAETKELQHEVWLLKKNKNRHTAKKTKTESTAAKTDMPWDHFVTVTTTPFLGHATDYDGEDLLYNLSSNNEDLRLLKQKQHIENEMKADGHSLDRPILQLSGAVEGEGFSQSGFATGSTVNSGVNLSTAELQMNAIASSWASAFMSFDFNGAPISSGNRAPNSSIYLGRGFATIGNLNRFPVYFTGGLMYVPFGRYANNMISTPLTQSMGRIRTPAALLGFSLDNGLHGSIYGFSGTQTSGGQPIFKQWGLDGGYKYKFRQSDSLTVGAGLVSNIADSEGMQNTGLGTSASQFGGFAVTNTGTGSTNNNALTRSVYGVDGHGTLSVGPVSLIGEYLGASQAFATTDMTFNNDGAKPQAMHAEADYLLPWFAKKYDTTLGVAYGHTWEALALNLPQNSYSTFLSTSIWRETTEEIEFRHDTDYSKTTTALGRGATANIVGTGRTRNSVLVQVGVFF